MQYILVADDNKDITNVLSAYLKREGFEPLVASDGAMAEKLYETYEPVALLLDVMMPEKDGYTVCKSIRKKSNVPIILITARGEDYEKIMGLDIGADDYIVKPFSPGEVMARLRAVLRRMNVDENDKENNEVKLDNMVVNLNEYTFTINGEMINLTKKEIETMWLLITNPNKVFTRDALLDRLWGFDYYGDTRTVDSHIKRLRAKIDQYEHKNWTLKTVWGVGYKLETFDE
ncbi:MAG: response regulator transcription factor [Lachnospiraceae bacterium]|nr:response regulator transcription factor [Lachnospiraceae bacterium]